MTRLNFLFLLIFSLVFMVGCSGDDSDNLQTPRRTADDVRNDFKNLPIDAGVNDLTLESLVESIFWDFRLIVPDDLSSQDRYPLVLRLHGGALNNAPEAHKTTDCLVEPGFDEKEVFILSPNSKGMLWYEEANIIQVLALLDLVKQYYPIDLSKILVTGYSDGGNGSWFFAQYYPDLFTAAIPLASSYNTASLSGEVKPLSIPLYVIHGENDELFPVEITEGFVTESINAGSDVTFTVASELGHYTPCDYSIEFNKAVDWLYNEAW